MKQIRWDWIMRILAGGLLGLGFSVVLVSYIVGARGPSPATCLLCTALGAAVGTATLPFADNGRSLLLCSAAHFGITAVLFTLLTAQLGARGVELLAWLVILTLAYAVIWLGRWVGW